MALRGLKIVSLNELLHLPGEAETPPSEFRIFRAGVNETSKGSFLFDAKAAASVMASFRDQGNELFIDYEHQVLADPPVQTPAAAWFKPELRNGELWATAIKWTPRATEYLRNSEYRYFSPAFATDKQGRILRLVNVALTNFPAMKDLDALVAAKFLENYHAATHKGADHMAKHVTEEMKKSLRDHMELAGKLLDAHDKADPESDDEEHAKALAGCVSKMGEAVGYKMDSDGDEDGDPKKATDDVPAETVTAETPVVPVETAPVEPAVEAPPAAETPVPAVEPAVVPASGLSPEFVALSGKSDPAEALGVVRAWKEDAAKVVSLNARIAELEKVKTGDEFAALVALGEKEWKLTPADRKSWVADLEKQPNGIVILKSYLANVSPRVTPEVTEPPTGVTETVALTNEDKKIAKLLGNDLEKVAEHRKQAMASKK